MQLYCSVLHSLSAHCASAPPLVPYRLARLGRTRFRHRGRARRRGRTRRHHQPGGQHSTHLSGIPQTLFTPAQARRLRVYLSSEPMASGIYLIVLELRRSLCRHSVICVGTP